MQKLKPFFLAGVMVVTSTAAMAEQAKVVSAAVTLADNFQDYSVTWETVPPHAPVTLTVAESANSTEQKIIAQQSLSSGFQWRSSGDPKRRYFTVTPNDGEAVVVASRVLPLEGGRNFRDLGGYETADGKTVKWGKVFRSGVMNELTDRDYDLLAGMGIKTVCDLRAAQEREAEPTDWRAGKINYLTFPDPIEDEDSPSPLRVLRDPNVTPERVADAMAEGYVGIAMQQAPAYRAMFDRLASGEIPLAFNCSAGKDRAGTGAAFLLTLLGVPRDVIFADYAMSENVVDYMSEFLGEDARAEALENNSPYAFLFELPSEVVAPLLRSDPRYIESTFTALEKSHGSVMTYIESELQVTPAEASAIRAALLH